MEGRGAQVAAAVGGKFLHKYVGGMGFKTCKVNGRKVFPSQGIKLGHRRNFIYPFSPIAVGKKTLYHLKNIARAFGVKIKLIGLLVYDNSHKKILLISL